MDGRRVAVVGGGPGGLYAARLVALAHPGWRVTVHEHNADGRTFGFGVGLTPSTLRSLEVADPVSAAHIRRAGHPGHGMEMRVGRGLTLAAPGTVAIDRGALLDVLRTHATAAGVRVETAHVTLADLDADLIVAADGARSAIRTTLAAELGTRVDLDDGRYLWAGTDFALRHATFAAAHTSDGVFVVHAYPYAPDRSTFLVETDEATWRRAGLDGAAALTPDGATDERSLDHLAAVFADVLEGHGLLGNRTRWQRFATIRCDRWHHGDVVLVGDAAHTAHYSIGSGTKLALEDAIALAEALRDHPDTATAAASYEAVRRPRVERFQAIATRSHVWWKTFPRRLRLDAAQLVTSYMTRAGNVTVDGFATLHPDVVADAVAAVRGEEAGDAMPVAAAADPSALAAAVLDTPAAGLPRRVVDTEDLSGLASPMPERVTDVWGPEGSDAVERARELLGRGARILWLTGGPGSAAGPATTSGPARAAVLARCDLAERLRLDTGAVVGVDLPRDLRSDAVGAVLAGRTDLVRFR